jgi:hypothetical protein
MRFSNRLKIKADTVGRGLDQNAGVKGVNEAVTVSGCQVRTVLKSAVRSHFFRPICCFRRIQTTVARKLPQKLSREDSTSDFDLVSDQLDKRILSVPTYRVDASQINNEFAPLKIGSIFLTSGHKFIGPGRNKGTFYNKAPFPGAVDNRYLQHAHLSLETRGQGSCQTDQLPTGLFSAEAFESAKLS